ncbi:MAG: 16S rRNA (cytidine(1402)-2'-O)-methyltransferase [Ilumatobacteraceae bacterium]
MAEEERTSPGRLVLVATPIGNLGDLSPRAVQALTEAGLVCCEDTRRTGRLLHHAGVRAARLAVCNEHTELARLGEVLTVLGDGHDVAVVTDAGTPGISDPGERLARAVLDAGYEVTAIPGPAALVQALVTSGLPAGRFAYEGFLPRSGTARRERLAELATERRTIVLYEAPHRVVRTLADLAAALGADRPVTVARELTKLHETILRGVLGDVDLGTPRGEYVLVVGGAPVDDRVPGEDVVRDAVRAELAAGSSRRDAAAAVAARLGVARRVAYDLAVTEAVPRPGTTVDPATVSHEAVIHDPVIHDAATSDPPDT